LREQRRNHVDVETNEYEFDRELFEPTHDDWDGDEAAMDGGHALFGDHVFHNENLNDEGDVIERHAQGTLTASTRSVENHLQ
jgi:hypothetical protein